MLGRVTAVVAGRLNAERARLSIERDDVDAPEEVELPPDVVVVALDGASQPAAPLALVKR